MWILIVIAILALLSAAVLLVARWCYRQAFFFAEKEKKIDPHTFYSAPNGEFCREPMVALVDELLQTPCERVSITSRDGLRLSGRLQPQQLWTAFPRISQWPAFTCVHTLSAYSGGTVREFHPILLLSVSGPTPKTPHSSIQLS